MLEPFAPSSLSLYWPIVAEGALVAVALGLIGCFLVVRGVSLLGDALSHSVLPGIVIGFLIGGSLHSPWILIGATAVGLGAALLVQAVQHHSRVKEDASLGIVFTALFALGVVMINLYAGQADLDPGCVLYGNIEAFLIDPDAIWLMVGILGTIVIALVLPGATARLWTDRMPPMLAVAAVHGLLSTILGYWLSHPAVMNTSASGAICLAGFVLFLVSWMLAPRHGLLHRARVRRRLVRTTAVENLLKAIEELSAATGGRPVPVPRVAADLRVPPRAFAKSVGKAMRSGWVLGGSDAEPEATLALTDAGRSRSQRLVRAHELWERYLRQEVGLDADHVHDAAEWVEHYLSEHEVSELDALLAESAEAPPASVKQV